MLKPHIGLVAPALIPQTAPVAACRNGLPGGQDKREPRGERWDGPDPCALGLDVTPGRRAERVSGENLLAHPLKTSGNCPRIKE